MLVLCLAIMALAVTSCVDNSPAGVAKEYLESIKAGDYKKTVELMHFNKELSDNDKEQLVSFFNDKAGKSINAKQGITSYSIDNTEVADDGQSASITYTINYGDGSSDTNDGKVVKVGDEWKIDSGK